MQLNGTKTVSQM